MMDRSTGRRMLSLKNKIVAQRKADKIAEWLLQSGAPTEVVEKAREETLSTPPRRKNARNDLHMEAEAVLYTLLKPQSMESRLCAWTKCNGAYLTNYHFQAYCSLTCTQKALAEIGIELDLTKQPEDRWGGQPPLKVNERALANLRRLLSIEPNLSTQQKLRLAYQD